MVLFVGLIENLHANPIMITATINPAAGMSALAFLYSIKPAEIPTQEINTMASVTITPRSVTRNVPSSY